VKKKKSIIYKCLHFSIRFVNISKLERNVTNFLCSWIVCIVNETVGIKEVATELGLAVVNGSPPGQPVMDLI
jgi:hypothetical protein